MAVKVLPGPVDNDALEMMSAAHRRQIVCRTDRTPCTFSARRWPRTGHTLCPACMVLTAAIHGEHSVARDRIAVVLAVMLGAALTSAPAVWASSTPRPASTQSYIFWGNYRIGGTGNSIGRASLDGMHVNQEFIEGAAGPSV